MSSNSRSSLTDFQTLFQIVDLSSSSSVDPTQEEWSSLLLEVPVDNPKVKRFEQGLFDPGSGDVCAKYLALSDSYIYGHRYYNYPCIKDPGIYEALLEPELKIPYPLDGQDLYLALCKEMNVAPIGIFHRNLLNTVIDLRYYCVNSVGVRAMCLALTYNTTVKRLDLTSSFLNAEACYHLGKLLHDSKILTELVLSGCRIGQSGLNRLVANLKNDQMDLLDLSKNRICDDGLPYLTSKLLNKSLVVKRLNLSYNELGPKSVLNLVLLLEFSNNFTHLDLSWNNISAPKGANALLRGLGESRVLTELNLSWTGLVVDTALEYLFDAKNLEVLDLSNNRLGDVAVKTIASNLRYAKKLVTLNLSSNPVSTSAAFELLGKMKLKSVKLKNLLMENIDVRKEFVVELEALKSLDYKVGITVRHGTVIPTYTLPAIADMRMVVMKRLCFLALSAPKKTRTHIAIYFLQKRNNVEKLHPRDMLTDMKTNNVPIGNDLIAELSQAFPGPKISKGVQFINLNGVVDFVRRCWPDMKAPATPPTPPPSPVPVVAANKGKGKEKVAKNKKK